MEIETISPVLCPYCKCEHNTTAKIKELKPNHGDVVGMCSWCANPVLLNSAMTEMRFPSPTQIRNIHEHPEFIAVRLAIMVDAMAKLRPRPRVTLPADFPPELREIYDNIEVQEVDE